MNYAYLALLILLVAAPTARSEEETASLADSAAGTRPRARPPPTPSADASRPVKHLLNRLLALPPDARAQHRIATRRPEGASLELPRHAGAVAELEVDTIELPVSALVYDALLAVRAAAPARVPEPNRLARAPGALMSWTGRGRATSARSVTARSPR
jgi:hypothetical protein